MSYWDELRLPTERDLVVGFFDLTGYTKYCTQVDAMRALDLITSYIGLAASLISSHGGWFVKAIGDAGLFAFPGENADSAVTAALELQTRGDAWLASEGYKGRARIVMHAGPAAIGRVGAPGREQLDVIGKTVNTAGGMKTDGFLTITPALFRRLSPESRRAFKKHTPPIVYIGASDPRPASPLR